MKRTCRADIAERAAELCAAAEVTASRRTAYVIGTEVPVPGGEPEAVDTLAVTRPEDALRTLALHRAAFAARGVAEAMERVVALVVQPGVEIGNAQVFGYDKDEGRGAERRVRRDSRRRLRGAFDGFSERRPRCASSSRHISPS